MRGGDDDPDNHDVIDIPPADYVIYSGCARSSKHIEQIKDAMDIYVGQQAIKGLFLMGCIIDIDKRYAGEPFDDHLRRESKLNENCTIERIGVSGECQFGLMTGDTYHIESGCLNGCPYCMMHYVGNRKPRSADRNRILKDLQEAYDNGLRILKITGENAALFGVDVDGKQHLHELIWDISKIGFTSVFINNIAPQNIYPELVEALKMAPHIDGVMMSLETADEGILKSVGRSETADVISDAMREIRTEKPWFYAEVSMVTGLPGETEETHQYTKKYLRDNFMIVGNANALHSHESLPVSKLPNQVDRETAERRRHDLYDMNRELIENYIRTLGEHNISMPLTVEEITDATDDHGDFKRIRFNSPFEFGMHTSTTNESGWQVGDIIQFFFRDARVYQYMDYTERTKFHIAGYAERLDPNINGQSAV